jgi:pimeloyl-ACP methyl ester carboxylesterase/DNA-binding CsgD family transcriptional regulator
LKRQRNADQFRGSLAALALRLAPEERACLDAVSAPPVLYRHWHRPWSLRPGRPRSRSQFDCLISRTEYRAVRAAPVPMRAPAHRLTAFAHPGTLSCSTTSIWPSPLARRGERERCSVSIDRLPQLIVRHFYDDSVTPERVQEIISRWDAAVPDDPAVDGDRSRSLAFAQALGRALDLFEQLHACNLDNLDEILGRMRGAAMAVAPETGIILALNDQARITFGLERDLSLRQMPLARESIELLCERMADLGRHPRPAEDLVRLDPVAGDRVIHAHLRRLSDCRSSPVLVMTGEQAWPVEASVFLARVFRLTPAETEVLRHLATGGTVATVARVTARSKGTIRSQIHSVLEKTGAATQVELVRLVTLIIQTAAWPEDAGGKASPVSEPTHRFLRLADGRRVELLTLGDPAGDPVVWLHTYYGLFRLPRQAELALAARGLRLVIPLRAGWGGSDPLPAGGSALGTAVGDLREVMAALGIVVAPIVAPGDDIRIALMLARAAPEAVSQIIGLGCGFPILNDEQYRRLMPVARIARACARYQPRVLPIMAKAFRTTMLRYGIDRYMRGMVSTSVADSRALTDPEVAAAHVAGVRYMYGHDARAEAAFCREMREFVEPWPDGLGAVPCPVTLLHGAQDMNAPLDTAQEYCGRYPQWRLRVFPDEGQYVGLVRWPELLDLIEAASRASAQLASRADAIGLPLAQPEVARP